MKIQSLLCLLVLLLIPILTSCSNEVAFCGGINETNMPARVVLVENARNAARYSLKVEDNRFYDGIGIMGFAGEAALINRLPWCCSRKPRPVPAIEDPICIPDDEGPCYPRDEGFTMGYPSCAALDGFGALEDVHIYGVERVSGSHGNGRLCEKLKVSGMVGENSALLSRPSGFFSIGFLYIISQVNDAPVRDGIQAAAESFVSISPVYAQGGGSPTESPMHETALYAQDTADGSPPLMISRIWHFSDAPENAVFREYLGIEEEGAFTCGDLYFGYFAR